MRQGNERIILSVNPDEFQLIKDSLNLSIAFISMTNVFQKDIKFFQTLVERIEAINQIENTKPVCNNVINFITHR